MDNVPAVNNQSPPPAPHEFGQIASPYNGGLNAGAIAIETERAIAEVKGRMVLSRQFPRDMNRVYLNVVTACKSAELAKVAFYSRPQGGNTVTGPSIRLAEEVARLCGNISYGHRELSRDVVAGKSEIEIYAWDLETNVCSTRQLTVMHRRDVGGGTRPCKNDSEIDELIANKASKQMRGRLLAIMPKSIVSAAEAECKRTLAGGNEKPVSVRVNAMLAAFSASFGVGQNLIETYLGHSTNDTTIDELADLHGVFNALRDGAKASEFFRANEEKPGSTAALINARAQAAVTAPQKQQPATDEIPMTETAAASTQQYSMAPETQAEPEPLDEPEPQQEAVQQQARPTNQRRQRATAAQESVF